MVSGRNWERGPCRLLKAMLGVLVMTPSAQCCVHQFASKQTLAIPNNKFLKCSSSCNQPFKFHTDRVSGGIRCQKAQTLRTQCTQVSSVDNGGSVQKVEKKRVETQFCHCNRPFLLWTVINVGLVNVFWSRVVS